MLNDLEENTTERTTTIKSVASFDECESFVNGFLADKTFSDPMLSNEQEITYNLINAIEKTVNHVVISISMDQQMIGLFSFLALQDEQYLEMLVGLSRHEEAYDAMLAYLKERFPGYGADFVFNPNNYLLQNILKQNNAGFEEEVQRMVHNNSAVHLYESMGFEKVDGQNSLTAHLQI